MSPWGGRYAFACPGWNRRRGCAEKVRDIPPKAWYKGIVRSGVFLRINAPVWLLVCGASTAGVVAAGGHGPTRLVAILVAWWCTAGAVMLLTDFPRKRALLQRLCREPLPAWKSLPDSLTGTVCGVCVLWAAHYRARCVREKRILGEELL